MAHIALRIEASDLKLAYPAAVRRALNRAATSTRAFMASKVASDAGVRVGTVRDATTMQLTTGTEFVARIAIVGKRIPLIEFNARGPEPSRGRGSGVRAKLPGGRGHYPHAFIATMRSGHRGVFQRVPGAKRRGAPPHRSQLPIYQLFGPSLPHVFAKHMNDGAAHANDALRKNLQSELRFAATIEGR